MTQQHPITPPPELVRQWCDEAIEYNEKHFFHQLSIATRAAQWGADQELEACIKWLNSYIPGNEGDRLLRAARRPKPPSLKEQALALLDPSFTYGSVTREEEYRISVTKAEIIRRALEQLDD